MKRKGPYISTFIAFFLLFFIGTAFCEIEGRMELTGKNTISITLKTKGTSPKTMILLINYPKDLHIKDAEPKISQVIPQKGEAKWLLKGFSQGNKRINIEFFETIEKKTLSKIKCKIRYKERGSDKIIEKTLP